MQFRIFVPHTLRIDDGLLVGLAERANKRLRAPLQAPIQAEELMWQAEIEGFLPPIPDGAHLVGEHMFAYSRAQLSGLARRHSRPAPALPTERKQP